MDVVRLLSREKDSLASHETECDQPTITICATANTKYITPVGRSTMRSFRSNPLRAYALLVWRLDESSRERFPRKTTHRVPITTWEMNVEITKDRDLMIVDFRQLKDVSHTTRARALGLGLTGNARKRIRQRPWSQLE